MDREIRIVAVGNKIHRSKSWVTFHDFLSYYVKSVLGWDWGQAELRKSLYERHPLLQWFEGAAELHRHTYPDNELRDSTVVRATSSTASASAWLRFAYDLYLVDQQGHLSSALLKRLRNRGLFQGARYELMVAAEFVRAGFHLSFINERHSTTACCEFDAFHDATADAFTVEAKSLVRRGFLGKEGQQELTDQVGKSLGRVLRDALLKSANYTRVIFVEINIPPGHSNGVPVWIPQARAALAAVEDKSRLERRPFPPAYVVFTNRPNHLVEPYMPEPQPNHGLTAINVPVFRSGEPSLVQDHLDQRPALRTLHERLKHQNVVPHEWGLYDVNP